MAVGVWVYPAPPPLCLILCDFVAVVPLVPLTACPCITPSCCLLTALTPASPATVPSATRCGGTLLVALQGHHTGMVTLYVVPMAVQEEWGDEGVPGGMPVPCYRMIKAGKSAKTI